MEEFYNNWIKPAIQGASTVTGAVLGTPLGATGAGAGFGGVVGGLITSAIDAIAGVDDTPATSGSGLGFGGGTSGGGGAGASWAPPGAGTLPGLPNQAEQSALGGALVPAQPGGGLQGPVYGTQSGVLNTALNTVLGILRAYPAVSDLLQRHWNFPREEEVARPNSALMWRTLAQQLPKTHREALEQFLSGFPSPIGLSQAGNDVFLALLIAESGYEPVEIGCCVSS